MNFDQQYWLCSILFASLSLSFQALLNSVLIIAPSHWWYDSTSAFPSTSLGTQWVICCFALIWMLLTCDYAHTNTQSCTHTWTSGQIYLSNFNHTEVCQWFQNLVHIAKSCNMTPTCLWLLYNRIRHLSHFMYLFLFLFHIFAAEHQWQDLIYREKHIAALWVYISQVQVQVFIKEK